MFKKISVLVLLLISVVSLTSCGSSSKPKTASVPFSWNGSWSTNPSFMSAIITDDVIKINIVDNGSTSLYWKGSWPTATTASDGAQLVSNADTEALAASIMGSQSSKKTFTYADHELTFEFTMLGTTKTVHLKKD